MLAAASVSFGSRSLVCRAVPCRAPLSGVFAQPWTASTRRRFADDGDVPMHHTRHPQRYFDFKGFREALKEKRTSISEAELREIRREYAPPPPEGWTIQTFLETMGFGDGAEDLANLFERWEDFISMNARDIMRIPDISVVQRRKLDKFVTLFNHGLWPKVSQEDFFDRFGGTPLEREGQPWTAEEDNELLRLAGPTEYDATFGDPWIYLAWELQRREHEVRDRYVELVVKPRENGTTHELAITKASKPLQMHRMFRMIPADLFIVPSETNFPLAPRKFEVPAAFKKYRQDDIF